MLIGMTNSKLNREIKTGRRPSFLASAGRFDGTTVD